MRNKMTKEKFTNGEWEISHQNTYIEIMDGGVTIYFEPYPTDEEVANAYLIAAAPEMYQALKDITKLKINDDCKINIEAIKKLLSKARG